MSGGRYDFLCYERDLDDLVNREHTLREMSDRLAALGYAEDAAKETEELLVLIRQWKVRTEVRAKRLADIWRAVEWWDSGDGRGEIDVHEALAAYRNDSSTEEAKT